MDREKFIWDKMKQHYDEAKSLGKEVFAIALQGSQNYNLDIYEDSYMSDIDTKAIILPSFEDFCEGSSPISKTHERENKEHIDLKDIRVMFDTFKKQNVNFVEILFTDYFIVPDKYSKYWEHLRSIAEDIVHCHPSQTLKTMSGLSMEKKKALCHPYPTIKYKIDKWGYDGKQLHHIIRINEFMKNYISGVPFKDCMSKHSPEIYDSMIKAKLNRYSLDEAVYIADKIDEENRALKDDYIDKHGIIFDGSAYKKLNDIKIAVLKQWFKEQLSYQ